MKHAIERNISTLVEGFTTVSPAHRPHIPDAYFAVKQDAEFYAHVRTSYAKNFGDNAVKAAEGDWIGRAVELLVSFANDDPCAVDDFRSDEVLRLLSLTKASKP